MSPGTESFMDATSALHHATPSKAKLFSLFSFISLYLSIYSTGDDSQPMLLTHKSERRVCVCLHNISCFCRISLLFSAGFLTLSLQLLNIIVVFYVFLTQGAVLSPSMEHPMSLQPSAMLAPLTQQMGHLSLGGTATV